MVQVQKIQTWRHSYEPNLSSRTEPPQTKFTPQIPTSPCLFNQQLIGWTSNSLVEPVEPATHWLNHCIWIISHPFFETTKNYSNHKPKHKEVFPYRLQYVAQIFGFADLLGHDASQKVPNIFLPNGGAKWWSTMVQSVKKSSFFEQKTINLHLPLLLGHTSHVVTQLHLITKKITNPRLSLFLSLNP